MDLDLESDRKKFFVKIHYFSTKCTIKINKNLLFQRFPNKLMYISIVISHRQYECRRNLTNKMRVCCVASVMGSGSKIGSGSGAGAETSLKVRSGSRIGSETNHSGSTTLGRARKTYICVWLFLSLLTCLKIFCV